MIDGEWLHRWLLEAGLPFGGLGNYERQAGCCDLENHWLSLLCGVVVKSSNVTGHVAVPPSRWPRATRAALGRCIRCSRRPARSRGNRLATAVVVDPVALGCSLHYRHFEEVEFSPAGVKEVILCAAIRDRFQAKHRRYALAFFGQVSRVLAGRVIACSCRAGVLLRNTGRVFNGLLVGARGLEPRTSCL